MMNRLLPISTPKQKINKKIQKTIEEYSNSNSPELLVIPQLKSIERSDVEKWSSIPIVKNKLGNKEIIPIIRNIYSSSICTKDEKISMEKLTKQIKKEFNF